MIMTLCILTTCGSPTQGAIFGFPKGISGRKPREVRKLADSEYFESLKSTVFYILLLSKDIEIDGGSLPFRARLHLISFGLFSLSEELALTEKVDVSVLNIIFW
jgi:hypothetical protein